MSCWNCNRDLNLPNSKKLSFRAACDACGADLHSCINCKYYSKGRPNDCAVPGTDFVRDRERNNFCEEFSVKLLLSKFQGTQDKKRFEGKRVGIILTGGNVDLGKLPF